MGRRYYPFLSVPVNNNLARRPHTRKTAVFSRFARRLILKLIAVAFSIAWLPQQFPSAPRTPWSMEPRWKADSVGVPTAGICLERPTRQTKKTTRHSTRFSFFGCIAESVDKNPLEFVLACCSEARSTSDLTSTCPMKW